MEFLKRIAAEIRRHKALSIGGAFGLYGATGDVLGIIQLADERMTVWLGENWPIAIAMGPYMRWLSLAAGISCLLWIGHSSAKAQQKAVAADAEQRRRDLELPLAIERRRILSEDAEKLAASVSRLDQAATDGTARLTALKSGPYTGSHWTEFQRLENTAAINPSDFVALNVPALDYDFQKDCKPKTERPYIGSKNICFEPKHPTNERWLAQFEGDLTALKAYVGQLRRISDEAGQEVAQMNQQITRMVKERWT